MGTVLLVEDETIVRTFARTVLERAGYRVTAAACGVEALEVCERMATAIDVLVTDMVMPGMSGRELAERILAQRPETRVVLMSGYTEDAAVTDLSHAPVPAFLQKPFSPHALVRAVDDAVRQPRQGESPGPEPCSTPVAV